MSTSSKIHNSFIVFFFSSRRKRARAAAENMVRLARKVINYRRDQLDPTVVAELTDEIAEMNALLGDKSTPVERIEQRINRMDRKIKPHGGQIYPVTFWSENVEMLIVAAILAIGIRSFFIQPFKIPTNSMYPTYYGMTAEVYTVDERPPSAPLRALRFLTLGAVHYSVDAEASGELLIPFFSGERAPGVVRFQMVPGRKFLVWPTTFRQYTFYVDRTAVSIQVPADFNLDDVILDTWFPDEPSMSTVRERLDRTGRIAPGPGTVLGRTGLQVERGQAIVDFDILTGDMLFVDRFSYNFVRPKIGDPFVFRTGAIPGLNNPDGTPSDQYYIKRLVGKGGDILSIDPPVLYRNNEPITGSPVFNLNHTLDGLYSGYIDMGRMASGGIEVVPDGYYYAIGDNSPNSYDSRGWGIELERAEILNPDDPNNFVPAKEVVGRALFIFYPFTSRWGPAK